MRLSPLILRAILALGAAATSPGCSSPANGKSTPSHLYWNIVQVTASTHHPIWGETPSIPPHFLADGSVIFQEKTTNRVRIRATNGVVTDVPLPAAAVAGGLPLGNPQITWYEDATHYGGSSEADGHTLGGGWAVLGGEVRECEGAVCWPVTRLQDGRIMTRDPRGQRWMTWTPGQQPAPAYPALDDQDARLALLDLVMPCFSPKQVGRDGSVLVRFDYHGLLDCRNNERDLPPVQLFKDFTKIPMGKEQFNRGMAAELDQCCDIWGINDKGEILGLLLGIPTIKSGPDYHDIGTERGEVAGFNNVGDVLFTTGEPAQGQMLWQGKTEVVQDCQVTKQLEGRHARNPLLTNTLAISDSGAVLFWDETADTATAMLHLATPARELATVPGATPFAFATRVGGAPPAAFQPIRLAGAWSPTALQLNAAAASANECSDHTLNVFATRSMGEWKSGDLIPVVTSFSPTTGTVIASASYVDGATGAVATAVSGGWRVTAGPNGTTTVTAEELVLKDAKTGSTWVMSGEATVDGPPAP
jgi:hypothetical protein